MRSLVSPSRFLALCISFLIAGNANAAALMAGAAKVDITDERGPVNDRLYARALVLKSGDTTAVLVTLDAVAIGGMATPLPSKDPEVNEAAGQSIRADKEWEARQGFLRGWVAHIFHMKTAADPFKELIGSGWVPTPEMYVPANYPIEIKVPEGAITVEGTRRTSRLTLLR